MKFVEEKINGHTVTIAFDENSIHIFNGYNIKDKLKTRGYRFNPEDKSWFLNTENVNDEIEVLKTGLYKNRELKSTDDTRLPRGKNIHSEFPESYTVTELRNKIEKIVNSGISGRIWIRGVIASEVKRYKWFSYFNLRDEEEDNLFFNVECRNTFLDSIEKRLGELKISDNIEKDLPVFLGVEVKISAKNLIDVRLNLVDIVPEFTVAKLRNQLDVTVEKLMNEGIFDNQKRLALPMHLINIGLITSELGTSVKDIMAGLNPFKDKYNFFFLDSRMEGDKAVDSVISSIDHFEKYNSEKIELIVIARGGGSEQSLSVFNDYRLCRRVCLSKIPVMAAIGHEKDISAIELCSFITPIPSTPSGVGKYLAQKFSELQISLDGSFKNIISVFEKHYISEKEKIFSYLKHTPVLTGTLIKNEKKDLLNLITKLRMITGFSLKEKKGVIEVLLKNFIANIGKIVSDKYESIKTQWERVIVLKTKIFIRIKTDLISYLKRTDFKKLRNESIKKEDLIIGIVNSLSGNVKKNIEQTEKRVQIYEKLVKSFDPETVLKRGYTVVLDSGNKIIPTLSKFLISDLKRLKFFDGEVEIEKKEKK